MRRPSLRILFWPRVVLPHAAVAVLGIRLDILASTDVLKV